MEQDWGGIGNCSSTALYQFSQMINRQTVMQANGLTILIVIFVGILVGIGLYMPHYRHRSIIRFFFLGATTLYLPILSYVISNGSTIASTLSKQQSNIFPRMTDDVSYEIMLLHCTAYVHCITLRLHRPKWWCRLPTKCIVSCRFVSVIIFGVVFS
jgi:glucan phosphoethanolaminetransferase (alkaline phosphatase superfamily)